MKTKLILLTIIAFIVLLFAQSVSARSYVDTYIFKHGMGVTVVFIPESSGEIKSNVSWSPSKGGYYTYRVYKIKSYPNDLSPDPLYLCEKNSSSTAPGNWTCTLENAPVGVYISEFNNVKGPTILVTYSINYP